MTTAHDIASEPEVVVTPGLETLSWCIEEIRRSFADAMIHLQGAVETGSDGATAARVARAAAHQAGGALTIIDIPGPGLLVAEIEGLLDDVAEGSVTLAAGVVNRIGRGFDAVVGYLDELLQDGRQQPLYLFPYYKAVLEARGSDRIEAAEFFIAPPGPELPATGDVELDASQRKKLLSHFEVGLLKLLTGNAAEEGAGRLLATARAMRKTTIGARDPGFWLVVVGLLEALASGKLEADVAIKRLLARLNLQLRKTLGDDAPISSRLLRDALFAISRIRRRTPTVVEVIEAWRLDEAVPADYRTPRYGRVDRRTLGTIDEAIRRTKQQWETLAAGERPEGLGASLSTLREALESLGIEGVAELAAAWVEVGKKTSHEEGRLDDELALEVAGSLLFAEEVFREGVERDPSVGPRSAELARRLRGWLADGRVDEPMPQWLRELTNRAHERAMMASFVAATRTRLGDVELTLDGYFRDRTRREGLPEATAGLREVGGVLSLVGQDEAARAAQFIADQVESLEGEAEPATEALCERIADSVGALGFLVEGLLRGGQDPVEYRLDETAGTFSMHPLAPVAQVDAPFSGAASGPRESAETRFDAIREAIAGRLRVALDQGEALVRDAAFDDFLVQWRDAAQLAGDAPRAKRADDALALFADDGSADPARIARALDLPGDWRSVEAAVAGVAGTADEDVDAELLEIFLAEAGEVLEAMRESLATIRRESSNDSALTTIRRGYHTLKGSSRMVGLTAFGELAWSFEQLLNFWLGENRPANDTLAELIEVSANRFASWVARLADAPSAVFDCARLIEAADALRESRPLPDRPWVEDPASDAPDAEDLVVEALAIEEPLAPEVLVAEAAEPLVPVVEHLTTEALPEDLPVEHFASTVEASVDASVEGLTETAPDADGARLVDDAFPGLVEEFPPDDDVRLEASNEAPPALDLSAFDVEPWPGIVLDETPEPIVEDDVPTPIAADEPPVADAMLELGAADGVPPETVVEDEIPVLAAVDVIVDESAAEDEDAPPLLTEPLDAPSDASVAPLDEVEIDGRRISASLYRIFLGEADETMAALTADLDDWRRTPVRAASEPAQRAMHSLKGSAAVVGIDEVHRLAQELERFLLRQRALGVALPEPELDEYAALLERLAAMLHQFAAGHMPQAEPETQGRAQALADHWSGRQIAAAPVPEPIAGAEVHEPSGAGAIVDELDAELLPIFIEEAVDQLPEIDSRLREWLQRPADRALAQTLMRLLHTVKGSARMAGAMRLGQRVHEMETRIEAAAELTTAPVPLIEELVAEHDLVIEMFEAIRDPGSAPAPTATGSSPAAVSAPALANSPEPSAAPLPAAAPAGIAAPSPATIAAALAEHATGPGLVRVRADLLERLVNESGEVSIARSRLDNSLDAIRQSLWDLTENVTRLRTQLREMEIQAETQIQTRIAAARESHEEFDPLEFDRYTRTQELTRMLAESVNDVATVQHNATRSLDDAGQNLLRQGQVLRELQQNLMRIRMVRFGTLGDRLYRVVRQVAKELGKRVSLDIRGSDVEIDRSVLERMAAPVEHLLRNAVAHGIESPDKRAAAGKSEAGEIRLAVRQEGNEVLLELRDDGSGLDLERIRSRAIEAGMLGADETIGEQGLSEMIFRPGFSTAESVSEISGRGVGMDVVRAEVGALGGRVEVVSEAGRGACFIVHLPLTLAIAQVVLVGVGNLRFALPSSSVEQVIQLRPLALAKAYAERRIDWQGEAVPLYYLGALVEAGDQQPIAQHYSPVVVMRAAGRRIAVHIDSVTRNQEVVVKNVGPQVARVRGVGGATILGNGEIVLILNLGPLAAAMGEPVAGGPLEVRAPRLAEAPPTVMVVDDSLTVRKASQRLLQRERYDVMLAKDGVDALRQLQERVPDAMLVDIEMPRMDGFDLTRHVRGDARYRHVPIVMISSRTADKHRNYAASLGVDAFLGKPYPEAELLELLRGYLARARASGTH